MSDGILLFVPHDCNWQPSTAAAKDAETFLWSLMLDAEIELEFSDQVEFHHPYQNWEGVRCPLCSALIDDDVFYDIVTKAFETSHFADLRMTAPCCGSPTSLDRMEYIWPAAFGRFVVAITSPIRELTDDEIRQLATHLGTDLHKIWRLL